VGLSVLLPDRTCQDVHRRQSYRQRHDEQETQHDGPPDQ
jgi:hypothetical protein